MRTGRYNRVQVRPHPRRRFFETLTFALIIYAIFASPGFAKIPGKVHCYGGVCHRVKTIAETERLIGMTLTVITTFYNDPGFDQFNRGQYTSSGEEFDANNPGRAASSTFPDGTELLVWNPLNGQTGHVRINDFGPFHTNRTLDVTRALAEHLGIGSAGVAALRVTVIAAPHRDEPRYRRDRTFEGARGYLGAYKKDEIAGLASELVAEAQRVRPAWPGGNAQLANVPIPVQKKAALSAPQVATAALPAGRSYAGMKLPRPTEDETRPPADDLAIATAAGVEPMGERLADSELKRLPPSSATDELSPSPPPTVTDALLLPPHTLVNEIYAVPVVEGSAVAAWSSRIEAPVVSINRLANVPAMDWAGLIGSTQSVDAIAVRFFIAGFAMLVMTALSLILLNGKANFATLQAAPLFPTMKRALVANADTPLRLSKRAQSALQALLPGEAPTSFNEPRQIKTVASFIGRQLRLAGKLTTRSEVIVEGRIDGDCACPRIVIKSSGGVAGDILAEEVVVHGTVEGSIQAKKVHLESTARVVGEVNYRDLIVQGGAFMEARFRDESALPLARIECRQNWENIERAAAGTQFNA